MREWFFAKHDQHSYQFAGVMERAGPVIESYCDKVDSPDDIVAVPGGLSSWKTIVEFCETTEAMRWSVKGDIERQLEVYSHGG